MSKSNFKKLRCAIIGGGINSEIGKIHISSLLIDNLWEIKAAAFSTFNSINLKTAKENRLNTTQLYRNVEELMQNHKNNLDAVIVITPTYNHFKTLKYLLKFNLPIICEKPIVASVEEAKKLKKLKSNKLIYCVYNYSCYPAIKNIKKDINKKKIGSIKKVVFNFESDAFINFYTSPKKWRLVDKTIPSILLDLGSHLFQLINYLVDSKPVEIVANLETNGRFKNIKDDCNCLIKLENGANGIVSISKSMTGNNTGISFQIVGSKGSIKWTHNNPENYIFLSSKVLTVVERSKFDRTILKKYSRFKPGHPEGFLEAFSNMYKDFYNFIVFKSKNSEAKFFGFKISYNSLIFLNGMNISNKKKKWQKIKY